MEIYERGMVTPHVFEDYENKKKMIIDKKYVFYYKYNKRYNLGNS